MDLGIASCVRGHLDIARFLKMYVRKACVFWVRFRVRVFHQDGSFK